MRESGTVLSVRANCKYCYKCLRNCPVKAIAFNGQHSFVIEDECVACGTCIVNCPQKAKTYRSDIESFEGLLGRPFVVSLAPSFYVNFEDPFKTIGFLKSLGCVSVSETAVGAEFVAGEYVRMLSETDGFLITTSCPVIVSLVEKYYPALVRFLMPVVSPAVAHSRFLGSFFGSLPKVFLGPCVAKKDELRGHYDAVLTFEELEKLMLERGRTGGPLAPAYPDAPYPERARSFPTSGGMLFSSGLDVYEHFVVEGMSSVVEFFDKLSARLGGGRDGGLARKLVVEASACVGGCLNGPASTEFAKGMDLLTRKLRLSHFRRVLEERSVDQKKVNPRLFSFDLKARFQPRSSQKEVPAAEVERVLKELGKDDPSKELNCTACGYETCRDKARAVVLGKAEKDMCFAYMVEKVSSLSNKVVDETPNVIIIYNDSRVLYLNPAAKRMFGSYDEETLLNICERISAEPNRSHEIFIGGRSYFFYPKGFDIGDDGERVLLLVDVTEMVMHREQMDQLKRRAVEKIEEVLNEQMKLAQEIASLLGESIAEAKVHFLEFKKHLLGDENANV